MVEKDAGVTVHPKDPKMTVTEFANSEDPHELAHEKLPHLDLKSLPSSV